MIEIYFFKVRDPITGKWHTTRYGMTVEEVIQRHGEGNYELLEWSKEVRDCHPDNLTAGHLAKGAQ